MTKILIVDDEQIEREALQTILLKSFPGLEIRQAKNGKSAVEITAEFHPELILMDIKMPSMNGFEAIEEISKDQPDIKFIMITAMDTFEYARKAIKLNVEDYLLKPSRASEICETVGRVLKKIEEEREMLEMNNLQLKVLQKALPLVETDVVTQLLFDHVHEVHLNELIELLGIGDPSEMFVMIVFLPPGSEHQYSAVKEKVRMLGGGWVGAMYGRQIPIIAFREKARTFRSQATLMAQSLLSIAKSKSQSGWFIGIGNACESLEHIKQSYQEALIASMDPTIPAKYRFYSETPVLGVAREEFQYKQQEKLFFDHIRLGQWTEINNDIMDFIQRYENQGVDLLQAQQRVLELLWIISRVLIEMGVETDTPLYSFQSQDYRQLRVESGFLLEKMKKSYEEHYNRLGPDTIQLIKQYIMEHSHEDITLEAIGKKVNLSPYYISKIFKEQAGINYIDYLTDCRIQKAIKLMADPEKSLKEITFEVGYHDPNYFSKVFRKMCGASPTEYRKTLLTIKNG